MATQMINYDDWNEQSPWGNDIFNPTPYRDAPEDEADFHAVFTVQLGELLHNDVIDFTDGTWYVSPSGTEMKWFDDDQMKRFWDKFSNRFYWREIGELPIKRWKWDVLSKLHSILPQYYLLYQTVGKTDPLQDSDKFGKSRTVMSDFPQTQLGDNQDYASQGSDREYEAVSHGSFKDTVEYLADRYRDIDMRLLDEFDTNFYSLLSSNVNGY